MVKLKHWLSQAFFKNSALADEAFESAKEEACFSLKYEGKIIGYLSYRNETWQFTYSEEFKKAPFVPPLINFPKLSKIYESKELFPFFITRIPTKNQPWRKKKEHALKQKGELKTDLVSLLKMFGEKTINNPFILTPC